MVVASVPTNAGDCYRNAAMLNNEAAMEADAERREELLRTADQWVILAQLIQQPTIDSLARASGVSR